MLSSPSPLTEFALILTIFFFFSFSYILFIFLVRFFLCKFKHTNGVFIISSAMLNLIWIQVYLNFCKCICLSMLQVKFRKIQIQKIEFSSLILSSLCLLTLIIHNPWKILLGLRDKKFQFNLNFILTCNIYIQCINTSDIRYPWNLSRLISHTSIKETVLTS